MPKATRQKKKEKYREATRLRLPMELQAPHTMRTHQTMPKHHRRCRRHPNDAQSITCDEETFTRCTKHHMRCTSIQYHLCKRKMTSTVPSDESNMSTAYPDPKSNTCNRNRDKMAEHEVPTAKYSKSVQSPSSKKRSKQDQDPIGQQKSLAAS